MPDADTTTTDTTATTDTGTDTGTATTDTGATTTTTTSTDTGSDAAAEVEKWKALARKHEQRAKDNSTAADELAKLRAAQMSDTERAVAEAKTQGQSEATKAFGEKLAAAEIKAALTGVVPDPSQVVDDLNLAKYVTDTGDVDAEAVKALREKYAAFAKPTAAPPPADFGGGNRGGDAGGKPQLTADDVSRMTRDKQYDAIEKARTEGRLNTLLGIT